MSRQLEESEPDEESEDKLYRQSSPKVDVEEDYQTTNIVKVIRKKVRKRRHHSALGSP